MNSIQNCQNFIPNRVQEGSFRIYIWSVSPTAKIKSENIKQLKKEHHYVEIALCRVAYTGS